MKVLQVTQEHFELIDDLSIGQDSLSLAQDGNNDWILGIHNRHNKAFKDLTVNDNGTVKTVYDLINEMQEIDYVQPIIEEE